MRAANKSGKAPKVDERGRRRNAAKRARALSEKKSEAMPLVDAPSTRAVRVVDAELVDPSPSGGLRGVFAQRYLLKLIVRRELASMYAASVLGLLWSYIQPMIRFATYYLVFGIIIGAHRSIPLFALHLFTGIVFLHLFTETWSGGTRSIWSNRPLVLKMRLPREVFPVASMIVSLYHTFPQVLLLVIICSIIGWHITFPALAAGLLGLAIIMSFGMAMGLLFGALNVFYRDFQNIVATVLSFLHFMVPMIYAFELVWRLKATNPIVYHLYMANPLATGVMLMQKLFWFALLDPEQRVGDNIRDPRTGRLSIAFPPDLWVRGLIMLVLSLVLLYLAQRFFKRVESKFPESL